LALFTTTNYPINALIRATVGLSLKRARLESVYSVLRGRDAKTGLDNPEKRAEQFALMQEGQKAALNLANWHHFLSALTLAGYRGEKMISSETAIIYSYVLYLIGISDYGIDKIAMRQAISERRQDGSASRESHKGPDRRSVLALCPPSL
jgi:hypothetical protein